MRNSHPLWTAAALGLAAALGSGPAYAARPMITDDARIVDAKSCQLESWVKSRKDSTEFWAQPACNFTGNLELTLGAARTREDGSSRTTDVVIQGKTLFKELQPNGWGWGLAVGNARHPNDEGQVRGICTPMCPSRSRCAMTGCSSTPTWAGCARRRRIATS